MSSRPSWLHIQFQTRLNYRVRLSQEEKNKVKIKINGITKVPLLKEVKIG